MAKFDTDEIGKPGKPPKARRFPWRLWMFAVVMTAAALGAGYYAWQYRKDATRATEDAATCRSNTANLAAAEAAKKECVGQLAATLQKSKDLEARLGAQASPGGGPKDEATVKRLATIDEIQRQLTKMSEAGQLKVTARRGSLVLAMPVEPLFTGGAAELTRPGELAVLEVGITLKRYPERRFLVTGHTDDTPPKSAEYKDNWELSVARALAVTKFLVQAGMDARNLIPAGVADTDPVSKDRAKNARIEIMQLATPGELPVLPASLGPDTALATPPAKPDPAKPEAPKAEAPPAPAPAPPKPAPPKP